MPQKDSIEVYEKLIGTDYKPALERFSRVLLRLGVPPDEVQRVFDAFRWEVAEGTCCVFAIEWDVADFKLPGWNIAIQPYVMGFTPNLDEGVTDNWFYCGFCLETYELIPAYIWRGHVPWHYPAESQKLIATLAQAMHQEFSQATIYFTDDSQDGDLMDAVMGNEAGKKWRFHYALFPLEPHDAYLPIPPSHAGRFGRYFEAWDRKTWPQFTS
ncbi:hypothetical protein [Hymenobacter cellulosivorans]|uniref:DUF4262 domain-containing protein n=1 Tax=Hymenobacter cellulosivorans TaxID=2932249 RepID=A0ABY4FKB5_9BACT|nr:hypothetical protein [Hymenobacter cellulosivorans]UOQ55256.1 hypothetical protein MUN80_10970 [Hymenobacter cellulosivorans]